MLITETISDYLQTHDFLKMPLFGVFLTSENSAFYDEKSGALLPPAREINFSVDFELQDDSFAQFLAQKENLSLEESHKKIVEIVEYWKRTLDEKKELLLQNIGSFFLEDSQMTFKGERLSTENPASFGLEKIELSTLNSTKSSVNLVGDYKKSNSKLWWLLFLVPAGLIIYFTTQNPELIFGQKSFPQQKKTKKKNAKKTSEKVLPADSLSIKNFQNVQK